VVPNGIETKWERDLKNRVLITGGAGFIGIRVARNLLNYGHEVSILDGFVPQIHGSNAELPADLRDALQLFRGDVRDASLCTRALQDQHIVVHLAAETGTGQSMYRVRHYSDVNICATATLMELLLEGKQPVQNVAVASSRAVYGEGAAQYPELGRVYPDERSKESMEAKDFEPKCPFSGRSTGMVAPPEEAPFGPSSLYGLTKQVQEHMLLMYAATLGINGFGLRYQNVYGPGQSLQNPYTCILAIFSNPARANEPTYIFEDGKESRDFVYVDHVVEATVRAVETPPQEPVSLTVGTGVPVTVDEVVMHNLAYFSSSSRVTITGAFREGDIRHNCADTVKMRTTLDSSQGGSLKTVCASFSPGQLGSSSKPATLNNRSPKCVQRD
jgi:dTDP-L-rhamnose 4-epimerase